MPSIQTLKLYFYSFLFRIINCLRPFKKKYKYFDFLYIFSFLYMFADKAFFSYLDPFFL